MRIRTPLSVLITLGVLSVLGIADIGFTLYQSIQRENQRVTRVGDFAEKGIVVDFQTGNTVSHEIRKAQAGSRFEIILNNEIVYAISEDYIEQGTGFFSLEKSNLIYAYATGGYIDGHKLFHLIVLSKIDGGPYSLVFDDPKIISIGQIGQKYIFTKLAHLKREKSLDVRNRFLINLELVLDGNKNVNLNVSHPNIDPTDFDFE